MTSNVTIPKAARLPEDIAQEIARTSAEDDRSQNGQLVHLLRIGLAGRERLKQLAELATASIAKASPAPSTAAADHLREHARLAGFLEQNEATDDGI